MDHAGALRADRHHVGGRVEPFTAEDLAGLEPGEVWAGGRAKTRKEFREYRADKC
ncbi:hypothetical protein [Streptomyces sp. A0592]|uniref:hypothetical protein n=1 Tax=Streptomyces sp. A0592 TaxID=2563099 RepID=UPI001447D9E6|nr:hypothetical protein [Streptomyces sp. A0592]